MLNKQANPVEKALYAFSHYLNHVGIVVLIAMMLTTVVDVFFRYVFNSPILGSVEVTKYMMVSLTFLGLAWCSAVKGNVKVDLIVEKFSPRVQAVIDSFTIFFSLAVYVLISVFTFIEARDKWIQDDLSDILRIPSFPFYFMVAFGSGILCLVIITHLVHSISRAVRK